MRPSFPLTVREATVDDAPELADLWHRAAVETALGRDGSSLWHQPDATEAAEALAVQLALPHRSIWVGEHEGHVVAAAAASLGTATPVTTTAVLIVTDLVVDPDRRRQGIAHQLLIHLGEFAEASACEFVVALVPGAAREPSRYLARIGFSAAASVRAMPTAALRSRLAGPPEVSHTRRIVAARRSMRRRPDGSH